MERDEKYKKAAINLLRQKEKGWSILYAIKGMKIRFILYCLLILTWLFLKSYLVDWFLLFAGLILGAFLRDIGWLILIKKRWKFTEQVTDWNKVKELADL